MGAFKVKSGISIYVGFVWNTSREIIEYSVTLTLQTRCQPQCIFANSNTNAIPETINKFEFLFLIDLEWVHNKT